MAVETHAPPIIVGVFHKVEQANESMAELKEAGFTDDQIGFAMREADVVTRAGEDALKGAVTGGVLGGIIGAATAFLIPGVGTVVAGGMLAEVLAGALAGASTAGLAGGFIGAINVIGFTDEEAGFYDAEFRSGHAIVTVKSDERVNEAQEILRRHGGYDIHSSRIAE